MKVKSSIKRICGFCYIVRRNGVLYVRCKRNNRHKQRQGFHTLNFHFKVGDPRYCECSNKNNFDANAKQRKDLDDYVESMNNDKI